jgi:hypothetical protein
MPTAEQKHKNCQKQPRLLKAMLAIKLCCTSPAKVKGLAFCLVPLYLEILGNLLSICTEGWHRLLGKITNLSQIQHATTHVHIMRCDNNDFQKY